MKQYLIISKHDPEECIRAMDEQSAKGNIERFVFGCKVGDHTGYAIEMLNDSNEAWELIPEFLTDKACVERVDTFTPADIKALHSKAA